MPLCLAFVCVVNKSFFEISNRCRLKWHNCCLPRCLAASLPQQQPQPPLPPVSSRLTSLHSWHWLLLLPTPLLLLLLPATYDEYFYARRGDTARRVASLIKICALSSRCVNINAIQAIEEAKDKRGDSIVLPVGSVLCCAVCGKCLPRQAFDGNRRMRKA